MFLLHPSRVFSLSVFRLHFSGLVLIFSSEIRWRACYFVLGFAPEERTVLDVEGFWLMKASKCGEVIQMLLNVNW